MSQQSNLPCVRPDLEMCVHDLHPATRIEALWTSGYIEIRLVLCGELWGRGTVFPGDENDEWVFYAEREVADAINQAFKRSHIGN